MHVKQWQTNVLKPIEFFWCWEIKFLIKSSNCMILNSLLPQICMRNNVSVRYEITCVYSYLSALHFLPIFYVTNTIEYSYTLPEIEKNCIPCFPAMQTKFVHFFRIYCINTHEKANANNIIMHINVLWMSNAMNTIKLKKKPTRFLL